MATPKKSRKSIILEWTGWKRTPSQRQLIESPEQIPRESFRSNVPQEWCTPVKTGSFAHSGTMMKYNDEPNPIEFLLKLITDIFGVLQGLFFQKFKL
jgi:hypothetical protein